MVYMKYLLGKTGWFPKLERGDQDIIVAADMIHDIKAIVTPRGKRYYYVMPKKYSMKYLNDLLRVFRANGIWLWPHNSRNYDVVVFRVPNRGQEFLHDVMQANHDIDVHKELINRQNAMNDHQR